MGVFNVSSYIKQFIKHACPEPCFAKCPNASCRIHDNNHMIISKTAAQSFAHLLHTI
jgi:hypothetical protein